MRLQIHTERSGDKPAWQPPLCCAALFVVASLSATRASLAQQRVQQGFYPAWTPQARYLQPLMVLDTYSALGRRNLIGAGIVVWWMILRESSDGATEI
ncbi:MAG TPA: hypothetical protein VFN62_04115 [Acidobacteriaceae bacterium]|nr:hypothetical protein [Acidobacteriaceae bacterium]